MVNLRLYTFDQWGNEKVTPWSFVPLTDEDGHDLYRESDADASGRPRRRPYQEREVRILLLGAGLLRKPANWDNFRRMLRAHKIEWQRTVGSAKRWVEFKLDIEEKVRFERLKDVMKLRRIKITLTQSEPLSFEDFERDSLQLADQLGPSNNS